MNSCELLDLCDDDPVMFSQSSGFREKDFYVAIYICVHNSQCFTICFRYLFQICFKYIALFGNDSPPDFAHRLPAEEAAEPRRCSPTQPRREDTTN